MQIRQFILPSHSSTLIFLRNKASAVIASVAACSRIEVPLTCSFYGSEESWGADCASRRISPRRHHRRRSRLHSWRKKTRGGVTTTNTTPLRQLAGEEIAFVTASVREKKRGGGRICVGFQVVLSQRARSIVVGSERIVVISARAGASNVPATRSRRCRRSGRRQ